MYEGQTSVKILSEMAAVLSQAYSCKVSWKSSVKYYIPTKKNQYDITEKGIAVFSQHVSGCSVRI